MQTKPVRLSQLRRQIPFASQKALRASLRLLEAEKIVVRHDLSRTVLHVEYDFADDMRGTAFSLLELLAQWSDLLEGKSNQPAIDRAENSSSSPRSAVDRLLDGHRG